MGNHQMGEQTNDIAQELALLHTLRGADFARQVERIARRNEFYPLEGEQGIYVCGGEHGSDYANLLSAARKAVLHGYSVYILPNPKGIRTADFILCHRNIYKNDLKTIHGKSSAGNRLLDSIGQTNRVLINIKTSYDAQRLALDIKHFFEENLNAVEVFLFKGKKTIVVYRADVKNPRYLQTFRKRYEK